MDRVFETDIIAARYINDRHPDHRTQNDAYIESLKMAIYGDDTIPMNSDIRVSTNDITVNGKKISFKAFNKETYQSKGCAIQYTIKLDKPEPISMWEVDLRHYNFQAIYLNGQKLDRSHMQTWSSSNSSSFSVMGKSGENTIVAIPSRKLERFKPTALQIFVGNLKERAKELGAQHLKIGDEEGAQHFRQILDYHASYGWLADGKTISVGFFYYLQSVAERKEKKAEDDRKSSFGHFARHLLNHINDRAKVYFLEQLRRRAPAWLRVHTYSYRGRPEFHSFHRHIESIARIGSGDDVLEHIRFFNDAFSHKKDDKDFKNGLRDSYSHFVVHPLRENSHFEAVLEVGKRLDELPQYSKNDWRGRNRKQYVGYAEQRIQAKAQLAGNPEAQQYYSEFELLMKRGAEDDRAVDSMVTLFRRAGPKMMVIDNNMRNLGAEMLYELESDKAFHQKVVKRAYEQFHSRINMALQRGNLEEMSTLIQTYGLLIRTDAIHKSLMDEYLDRCYYDKARYHALRLVDAKDNALRADAYAKILHIENILQMSKDERTLIPKKLQKETVVVAGEEKTLTELVKTFNGRTNRERNNNLGPGALLASSTLGVPNEIHNAGHGDYLDNQPYDRQCVEPISLDGNVYISSPTYIHAIDVKNNKRTWSFDQEVAFQPKMSGLSAVEYPATIVNSNVVRLWANTDGRGYSIRSFNKDGGVVWDFYDHQENIQWSPVCTPMRAFGLLYAVVYNNSVRDQLQFALVQLNSSNGRIEDSTPLNTMFANFSIEKARHGQHFYSDDNYLYGISGSGTIFKLNQKTLKLEWVSGKTLRSMRHYINPSAFVRPYGDTVVAFMPNLQEFIGVSSRSGYERWRWRPQDIAFIHTRQSDDFFIISDQKNTLHSIDPKTGAIKWTKSALNLKITGEGCVLNDTLYVPTKNGFATISTKDGTFKSFHATPYTPNKIRRDQSYWYLLSKNDIYIHAYGDAFSAQTATKSSSVFNEKPIAQSALKKKTFTHSDLYPHRTMTLPITLDESTNFHRTDVPHYFLIDRYREQGIALFREEHTNAAGQKVGDQIIWTGSKKSFSLLGDKIALWNKGEFHLEQIPNREVLVKGNFKNEYKYGGACFVSATDKKCVLFAGSEQHKDVRQIIDIDLESQRPIRSIPYSKEVKFLFANTKYYLLNDDKAKAVTCYNINDHKPMWTFKDKGRSEARVVGINTLLIGTRDHYSLVREDNGKVIYQHMKASNGTYANGIFVWGRNGALDTKARKNIKDLQKTLSHRYVGAAIKVKNKPFIWHDKDGSVELKSPYGHVYGMLASDRYTGFARLHNGVIHLFCMSAWACFDRKTGDLLAQERLVHEGGYIVDMFENSLAYLQDSRLITIRGNHNINWTIPYHRVSQSNESGWATEGWAKPQIIKSNFWIPHGDSKPRHKYAYQIGHDDKHIYMRFITSKAKTQNDYRTLKLCIEFQGQTEKNLQIDWNIDRSNHGVTDIANAKYVNTWKQFDSKGNLHCYFIFDRSNIKTDWHHGRAPRIHLELTEYNSGAYNGRFMLGGVAEKNTGSKIGYFAANHMRTVNTNSNYQLRDKVYSKTTDFYPQGNTLASWCQSRRSLHGHDGNIAFLKDMVKRCKDSSAAPNVIACLLWEHLDKWYQENPNTLDDDPEFISYRKKCVDELQSFCNSAGVSKDVSSYGLSFFEIKLYPYGNYLYAVNATHTAGHGKERHGIWINAKNDSQYVRRHDRPLIMHHLIGLYDSYAPTLIKKLHLRDPSAYLGPVTFHSPDKQIILIDKDLNYKNGLVPPTTHRNEKGKDKNIKYAYRNKIYEAKDFGRGNRSYDLYFDEIRLPKIPKSKFKSEDILLLIENLPSDSQIGTSLVWEYLSNTPEEQRKSKEEVFNIVLGQISKNPANHKIPEIIRELYNTYSGKNWPRKQILAKLRDDMKSHNIPRSMQRRIFAHYNNNIRESGRWYNLGVIKKEKDVYLKPAPEMVGIDDLFTTTFKYGDKNLKFQTSTKDMSRTHTATRYKIPNGNDRDNTLSYHYMKFELTEKKKLWFFLRQNNPHRYGANVGIWINGDEIYKDSLKHGDHTPVAIPYRLEAGTHHILIKYDFKRGWDLEFAIGDSYGLPLDIVELPRLIPIQ